MIRSLIGTSLILTFCLASLGCLLFGSSEKARPTLGEELIDLKKACDKGAITEEEYYRIKARLLEKWKI